MKYTARLHGFIGWRLFPPKQPYILTLYRNGAQEADPRLKNPKNNDWDDSTLKKEPSSFLQGYRLQALRVISLGWHLERSYAEPSEDGIREIFICRSEKYAHELGERFLRTVGGGASYDIAPSTPGLFIWWHKIEDKIANEYRSFEKPTEIKNNAGNRSFEKPTQIINDALAISLIKQTKHDILNKIFPEACQLHDREHETFLISGGELSNPSLVESFHQWISLTKNGVIYKFPYVPARKMHPRIFVEHIIQKDLQNETKAVNLNPKNRTKI